jgi:uncharacterized protein
MYERWTARKLRKCQLAILAGQSYISSMEKGPEQYWRTALAEGRFLVQKSRSTGLHVFPPRVMTSATTEDDLHWVEASGHGTVYAVTVISPKPPADAYAVVLVDLAEGPRLMSHVEGRAAADVHIGMAVTARIKQTSDGPLLVFDPA